jgi:DNA polymerase-3 subunit alpha
MLAYKTAYLKAHHPVAFMAAMLNSELSSSDAIAKYIAECRHMGIAVLPPDINESDWAFTVVGGSIRFGLGGVKGVGEGAIEEVLTVRRRLVRFRSLAHLACELDSRHVNRKVFESLVKAGAFDGLGVHRAALWAALDRTLEHAQRRRQEREVGQTTLFGAMMGAGGGGNGAEQGLEPAADPSVAAWDERERLRYEKETLGFYLTGNPLLEHEEALGRLSLQSTADLKEGFEGTATVGGMVTNLKRVKIKSGPNAGRFMGRFVLEDLTGTLPVTLFANQLQQFGHLLADEAIVLLKGEVRSREGEPELTPEEIVPLDKVAGKTLAAVELVIEPSISQSEMLKLKNLLLEHPGRVPVKLTIQLPDRKVSIAAQEAFKIDFGPELLASIEGLLGRGTVRERFTGVAG